MAYDIATIGDLGGRAPCSCCAACSQTYRGPHDALEVVAAQHAMRAEETMGRFAVWPSETRDLIARVDVSMRTTDATVKGCAGLPADMHDAWVVFFAGWQKFAAEEVTTFGSARKYDEAEEWRVNLGKWQADLETVKCNVPGPHVSTIDQDEATFSAVRLGTIAVIVVAGAYLLAPVVTAAAHKWAR